MTPRWALIALGVAAVVAVVIIGTIQATRRSASPPLAPLPAASVRADLAGSAPALAAVHAQAGQLLRGGSAALDDRLRALRGHPVVINKWASWCVPCLTEFPVLAHVAATTGREVAFLGIDSSDQDGASFLRRHPVSYPSYGDPSGSLGAEVTLSSFFPVTTFYDAQGRRTFIHQGGFSSVAELEQDITRYAREA